ncbi:MAG: hypothetical protein JZU52_12710 [Lamprocystis purpurea]|jgi:hypothetical protein|uniref:phage tail terminator protein n=1 Tax=Lamprocystis purpurea TaxID=61598 RepID=UPI0003690284|nr:hypothetical protein [Lamprocystis purpurea]MBV5274457.1 hypothetical protein [Lamprocystis purpurea]
MSAPFFDLAVIAAALAPLRDTGLVRDLRLLGSAERADPASGVRQPPSVLIVPERTVCTGPEGIGRGRTLTETIGILVQVRNLDSDDAAAATAIGAIRAAVWTALEGQRLAPPTWGPLRYQGGQMIAIAEGLFTWMDRYDTAAPVSVL